MNRAEVFEFFARLAADFAEAARLEQRFWQQGLDAAR